MPYLELPSPPVIMLKRATLQQGEGEERIFFPSSEAPEREGIVETESSAPHNSPVNAGGAAKVAGDGISAVGKGGKTNGGADFTRDDPPPGLSSHKGSP
jgi:hypothetical protein